MKLTDTVQKQVTTNLHSLNVRFGPNQNLIWFLNLGSDASDVWWHVVTYFMDLRALSFEYLIYWHSQQAQQRWYNGVNIAKLFPVLWVENLRRWFYKFFWRTTCNYQPKYKIGFDCNVAFGTKYRLYTTAF